MRNALVAVALSGWAIGVSANPSLADQINAVHQIEVQQQAKQHAEAQARVAEQKAQEQARLAEQKKLAAERASQARKAEQAKAQAAAQRKAEAEAVAAEAWSDKKRDQAYEDQLRELALEERKLKLSAMKARAERENDFIDQELRQTAAQTDVIQSSADATRNISEGGKALMTSEGTAREKEAASWFK